MGRIGVGVVVDHRSEIVAHESRYRTGQEHCTQHEQHDHRGTDQSGGDDAAPGVRIAGGPDRTRPGEQRDPDDQRPDRARQAEEGQRIERVGERGEQDVEDRPVEIGIARGRAGHDIHERRQRVNRRHEQHDDQQDRDRVASQQVHHEISGMSGLVETSAS